ncbi:hypothetical protein [Eubacterium sp. AB3007]|uniref:hypothetical protein n=1 Tax=Eubacterium sp. AB3007 TaxID=1392487 RepID=UPI000486F176|nr:hypothetical protein [Eubacterium sp. AB3007]
MNRKKLICFILTICMVLVFTACGSGSKDSGSQGGKQTAEAYLDQDGNAPVTVIVDISGGWSVEFARGAAYLYDGEIVEGKDSTAMLITLDKEVYDEYMEEAKAASDFKEGYNGVFYTGSDEAVYLTSVDDSAFIRISANKDADIEAITSRFTLSLDN